MEKRILARKGQDAMQMNDLILLTNKELHIELPQDYIELTNSGILKKLYNFYNIYFLDTSMEDYNKIPCAIGATKLLRGKKFIPPNNTLALMNDDGNIYFLNILSTESYKVQDSIGNYCTHNIYDWTNSLYQNIN